MAYNWASLMARLRNGQSQLDFGFSAADYAKRFDDGKMTLSKYRLLIVGQSGNRHLFNLYAFNPDPFIDDPQHYVSPCYRFCMIRHRGLDGLLPGYDQYHVAYRGNLIPPDRWAIRTKLKDSDARLAERHKQTLGRYPG